MSPPGSEGSVAGPSGERGLRGQKGPWELSVGQGVGPRPQEGEARDQRQGAAGTGQKNKREDIK